MLKLGNLKAASTQAAVVGITTFRDITGSVYAMNDAQNGISFIYEGGKFSGSLPADVANQLAEAAQSLNGSRSARLDFSEVVFEVTPASFGREKRSGLKVGSVLSLSIDGEEVYRDEMSGYFAKGKASKPSA